MYKQLGVGATVLLLTSISACDDPPPTIPSGTGGTLISGGTTNTGGTEKTGGTTNTGGEASAGGTGGSGGEPTLLVIDNCDDGNETNELGGSWANADDRISTVCPNSILSGGTFVMSKPGYGGTGYAAHMMGIIHNVDGWGQVVLGLSLGPDSSCPKCAPPEISLKDYQGLRFKMKGYTTAMELELIIAHFKTGETDNCTKVSPICNYQSSTFDCRLSILSSLKKDWKTVEVNFRKDLAASNSLGLETPLVMASHIIFRFSIQGTQANAVVDFWVDDVELYR